MFRRREKRHPIKALKNLIWPESGWHRSARYVYHRTARLPGSPYALAAGFACGAAISFTPLVSLHIILGALWAWAIRGSVVASAIGTVVGNPWTFPFIWAWIYQLGDWMGFGPEVAGGSETLDFATLFGHIMEASLRLDVVYLVETVLPVWVPMMVGSIPTAAAAWGVSYFALKPMIARYQKRRIERRWKKDESTGNATPPESGDNQEEDGK